MTARFSGQPYERDENPIDERYQARREMDERYTAQILALLTPEQLEAMPRNRGRRGGENRRGEGRSGRRGDRQGSAEFMQQFDTDGDGDISETEREAIRDHFRNQRGQGRGGGGRDDA